MTWQHVDLMDGSHELHLVTYRAGEYQLVITATQGVDPLSTNAASATAGPETAANVTSVVRGKAERAG